MLQGTTVALRALEKGDLPQLQVWRNHSGMRRYYREYRELTMSDQEGWYSAICCNNRNYCMFGIVYMPQGMIPECNTVGMTPGMLIGVCGLTNINWVLRSAELSFYIGHNDIYCDELYAKDSVNIMLSYAFNVLNMHKVWAEIYEFDSAKMQLFAELNMNKDAVLRHNAFDNGKYYSSLIYSVLEDEFSSRLK